MLSFFAEKFREIDDSAGYEQAEEFSDPPLSKDKHFTFPEKNFQRTKPSTLSELLTVGLFPACYCYTLPGAWACYREKEIMCAQIALTI